MINNPKNNNKSQEDILDSLIFKMTKAIDKKDYEAFLNLKASFLSITSKDQNKETPLPQIKKFVEIGNIEYLRNSIKIDEYARRINHRWNNLSDSEKEKYLIKKNKTSDSKVAFNGEKFTKELEKKFQNLQKKANFISRDAYYELMQSGYKAEKISIKKNSFSVPVLCNQESLVLKSKEDFKKFILQHEKNFNWDIEKRMRS
jgi:hypothetical protein